MGRSPKSVISITYLNTSEANAHGTLTVFTNSGKPFFDPFSVLGPSGIEIPVTVDPGGVERIPLIAPFSGWGRLEMPTTRRLATSTEVALLDTNSVSDFGTDAFGLPSAELPSDTVLAAVEPALQFRASVRVGAERLSALSIVNPSEDEAASVRFALRLPSGDVLMVDGFRAESEGTVLPLHQVRGSVLELIASCQAAIACSPSVPVSGFPAEFRGVMVISSNIPIAVAGVDVLLPEGRWIPLPISAR